MLRLALALLLAAPAAGAQTAGPAPCPESHSGAPASDGASIDAAVAALYDVISGPANEARDWDRFRALFHEAGRLVPMQPTPAGDWRAVVVTPDTFAERNAELMRTHPMFQGKGFYEAEAARRTERFGAIATVWSTYEGRLAPDEAPFLRGVNTIDLVCDGGQWRVLQVLWQQETPDLPLPAEYLSSQ